MKNQWIKFVLFILGLFVAIIAVPIMINECYKMNSGYATKWSAADLLSYYGAVLGSLIAIVTIVITISFTRKQILRDSYLKSETDKWAKIESIFATAIDLINPMRPLILTMDTGMTNPSAAVITFKKYQMSCKKATDQLNAYLNIVDYPKVKELLNCINKASNTFDSIAAEEVKTYLLLQDFNNRDHAKRVLDANKNNPNLFSDEDLEFNRRILERTNSLCLDDFSQQITNQNFKFVETYENVYKSLLQCKGSTFEIINTEIQKNADNMLYFGGKK